MIGLSDGSTGIPTLLSALRLVSLGLHLLPVPRGEKKSRKRGWHLPENLASTPARTQELFGRGVLNIGVCLGPSGLLSLDVDCREQAERLLAGEGIDLTALTEGHPHPIQARGERYWYRMPAGFGYAGVRQWPYTSVDGSRGMAFELRTGDSAQDIAPGSLHPSGVEYVWSRGAPPTREAIPLCPPELLALYQKGQGCRAGRTRGPATSRPLIPGQGGVISLGPLQPIVAEGRTGSRSFGGSQLDRDDVRTWVAAHHDMEQLLRQYGYAIEGRRAQCVLPDHEDRNPSCSYSSEHVYCHVCRQATDIIGLVMLRHGLNYRAAVGYLGYTPPISNERRSHADPVPRPECPAQDYHELVAHAATALEAGATPLARGAQTYLQMRGFNPEQWRQLGLGVIDDETPIRLLPRCWTRAGQLTTFPDWQALWRGRILLPDTQPGGISVKGRDFLGQERRGGMGQRLQQPTQKYMLAPGFRPTVFNATAAAIQPGPLLIVEGEFDCLSVMCHRPEQAVAAVPGVAMFSDRDVALLGVAGRQVLLMLDADVELLIAIREGAQTPVQRGAMQTVQTLQAAGADVWALPALAPMVGKDLNEVAVRLGVSADFSAMLAQHLRTAAVPLKRRRRID